MKDIRISQPAVNTSEADQEKIAEALDAIAAVPINYREVATALRAYFADDPSGIGWRLLNSWAATRLPDVMSDADFGATPVTAEQTWVEVLTKPADDPSSALEGVERPVGLPLLLVELVRLGKDRGPVRKWPEVEKKYGAKGEVITEKPAPKSRVNVAWFLERMGIDVHWDEFSRRFRVTGLRGHSDLDEHARRRLWFKAKAVGLDTPRDFFDDAVKDIADGNRRHPVREYLDSLKWDDKPRVENWLATYLGAEDSDYTRAVGKLFLVAAVRRARQSGVKFDPLIVLYGPQGAGKSSAGAALVPNATWFDDGLVLGAETKIVLEQTAGKWLLEINEMRGGKETEAIKAMITRTADTARKAYGEDAVTVPRQFVMLGTTDKRDFLNDVAGNRRYLPITVGAIDLDALRKDRDQLWAEAAAIEASGEVRSLVLPEDVRDAAKAIQKQHEMSDPIFEALEAQLGEDGGEIDKEVVYAIVGQEQVAKRNPKTHWAIRNAMTKLGWTETKPRAEGVRRRVYKKTIGRQLRFFARLYGDGTPPVILWEEISIVGAGGESPVNVTPLPAPPGRRRPSPGEQSQAQA